MMADADRTPSLAKRFAYNCADPRIPVPGGKGASIHVKSVCRALQGLGLDGEVFTVRPEAESLCGLPVRPISIPRRRKRKSIEDRETRLFLASLNTSISMMQKPDFIYERYTLWHAGGLAHARELDVPFILEVNSPLPVEAKNFRNLANLPLAEGIAQLLMRDADGIVCVSEEVAEWVRSLRGHASGVWVIPNGVDDELFTPNGRSRPAGLPESETPVIAFSGSFRPWHGIDDMLDAFHILVRETGSDAHLLLVGDGPMRDDFESKARSFGLHDRVHITGMVSHQEVPEWLEGATMAVAPYPQLEHFYFSPLKLYEFLALGLPVIATDVGQIRDVIPDGERGLLCPPGSPEALASAMNEILSDAERSQQLARAGRKWVLDNATWHHRVREILTNVSEL
jgi:glycosyltransferase involved in cell wall biosynthesis